jgi:probable rRNA maturation factor
MSKSSNVVVQVRRRGANLDHAAARMLIRFVLDACDAAGRGVVVRVVGDATMERYNRCFLGTAGPTDVISFPAAPPADIPAGADSIGDILVSLDQARAYAARQGMDPAWELARYIVHGVLHCLGYDDTTPATRRRMVRRQERLLQAWRRVAGSRSLLKKLQ